MSSDCLGLKKLMLGENNAFVRIFDGKSTYFAELCRKNNETVPHYAENIEFLRTCAVKQRFSP